MALMVVLGVLVAVVVLIQALAELQPVDRVIMAALVLLLHLTEAAVVVGQVLLESPERQAVTEGLARRHL